MYTNYPFGVCLAHNGNLTNVKELKEKVFVEARHINTDSVSFCVSFMWSILFSPVHVVVVVLALFPHRQLRGAVVTVVVVVIVAFAFHLIQLTVNRSPADTKISTALNRQQ